MAYTALARRFERLIASWRRHGIRHVLEVFRQERIRRAYARSPLPAPAFHELVQAFEGVAAGQDHLIEHLSRRCRELFPLTNEAISDREKVRAALCALTPGEAIERDARLIASGRFPALGLCIAEASGRFDWHRDYGSGKTWPRDPFDRIRYLEGDGADVKYVWELSRMYWIGWLGKAHVTSDDETWASEFHRLIDDWMKENPVNVGVNWTVAMEVGIRAFWLLAGVAFFSPANSLPSSWWADYFTSLWSHGSYILNNLEYFPNLTNHYIANCFGLLVVGAIFRESSEGRRWFEEGKERLATELERQITSDGVNYERSICYHGLVLEMYLIAAVVAERAGSPFDARARLTIEKMAEFTADYTPPGEGTIPQLGDSDDGAILRLAAEQNLYDHRRLLALAGEIFNRDDFRALGGNDREGVLLLFGTDIARKENPTSTIRRSSRYDTGGFATLRNEHLFLFADIGEIGLHGNNDTLGFTLHSSDGTSWLIDPGTGCYTRDVQLRNLLRSTAAHNAPYIDQTEIAEFAGVWRVVEDRTRPQVMKTNVSIDGSNVEEPLFLSAEHRAYEHLPGGGVLVRRNWQLDGPELIVRDEIHGSGEHSVAVRFTLPHEVSVTRIDDNSVELTRGSNGSTGPHLHFGSSLPLRLTEGFYSPGYGELRACVRIEIVAHASLPLEIAYFYRLVS